MSRLKKKYTEEIKKKLQEKFEYPNVMLTPRLTKIVISMGVNEALKDRNALQDASRELAMLSGQKPIITKSSKSIANFKLRQGQDVGLKVTLRGRRMYDFLDRFCNIVTPRIRDFRGLKRKGDRQGNYTLGLDDQQIYPEVDLDQVKRVQGMHVTFVTTATNDEECLELLSQFGMPFKKDEQVKKAG